MKAYRTDVTGGVPQVRWNRGEPEGRRESKEVAWRRGYQVGVYDAYRTIKKTNPRVAAGLLKAFGMKEDGSL